MDARPRRSASRTYRLLLLLGIVVSTFVAAAAPIGVIPSGERPASPQSGAVVASNGSSALIAWSEGDSPYGIFARRYAAGGFSEEPIPLADNATAPPVVAATSDGWLVAWPTADGVRVQFLGSGALGAPVAIGTPRSCNGGLQLASIGSGTLLLTGCGDITGTLLDAKGNVVREGIALGDARGYTFSYAETGEGSTFLVVSAVQQWNGGNEHDTLKATRVASDGSIAATFTIGEVTGAASHVSLAYDGTKTTAAWITSLQLYTTTIDPKATTVPAPRKASELLFDDLAIASAGGTTWLALREYGTNETLDRAKLVDGSVAELTVVAPRAWAPSIGTSGTQPLVVWTSIAQASRRVMLRPGDAAAAPVAPNAPDRFSAADAVNNGSSVIAVWEEDFGGISKIAAGGIDAGGQRIGGSGVVISGDSIGSRLPSIAQGSGTMLAVWFDADKKSVMGRRLNPALQPADNAPLVIAASSGGAPAVAFDGTNWLVVFIRLEDPSFPTSVAAVRISSAGAVLDDPPIPVSPFSWLAATSVDAAWDGQSFRVVWGAIKTVRSVAETEVRTARVYSDGSVLEVNDLAPDRIGYTASAPRIERGSDTTLLTWHENAGVTAMLQPRSASGSVALPSLRRRSLWPQRMLAIPQGQVLTSGPLVFDGTQFHLYWRGFNEEISHETIIAPSGYISQTASTWPLILGAARYGSGLALLTIDRTNAPGLFWTMR